MVTAADRIRTLLIDSNLDPKFWPEALKYFEYSWNRICPKFSGKTPFELNGKRKPPVRHLKLFGTEAYIKIPKQKSWKLEACAKTRILIGYMFHTRGYRPWILETDEIIESSNVCFNENSIGIKNTV